MQSNSVPNEQPLPTLLELIFMVAAGIEKEVNNREAFIACVAEPIISLQIDIICS